MDFLFKTVYLGFPSCGEVGFLNVYAYLCVHFCETIVAYFATYLKSILKSRPIHFKRLDLSNWNYMNSQNRQNQAFCIKVISKYNGMDDYSLDLITSLVLVTYT